MVTLRVHCIGVSGKLGCRVVLWSIFCLLASVLPVQREDDNVRLAIFQGKKEGGIRDASCVLGRSLCFIFCGFKGWLFCATLE